MLAPDIVAVFDALSDAPGTESEVFERLSATHDLAAAEGEDVRERVNARLTELAGLALADPLP